MSMNRAQAFKAAEKRIRRGSSPFPENPTELLLKDISTFEPLFQTRKPTQDESEAHVNKLSRAIARRRGGKPLDPIQVFWLGDAWVCIDGHHRLKAYKQAVAKGHWQEGSTVPVSVFAGGLLEASAEGGKENGKVRLEMRDGERDDHAWSFVILDAEQRYSKEATAAMVGVATSTIGNMRRVLAFFRENYPAHDPAEFRWREAAHLEKFGDEKESKSADERRRADIERFARLMRKSFKEAFTKDASLLVEVVREAYSADFLPVLSRAVADALAEGDEDTGRDQAEEAFHDF